MGITLIVVGSVLLFILLAPKKLSATARKTTITKDPDSIDSIISENAKRYSVDPALIKAIIRQESNFNPNAVNPSDPSYGLMQIMPILAEDYGVVRDYHNPTQAEIAMIKVPATNVRIGTWFLSKLLNEFTLDEAIQMYNVGRAGYLSGRRAPDYLSKVKGYYNEYKSN